MWEAADNSKKSQKEEKKKRGEKVLINKVRERCKSHSRSGERSSTTTLKGRILAVVYF
jgi:hypothetical protein